MAQPKSIQGRVVAITGGARGIGRATAGVLLHRGARVAIGDVDVELAERTAAELGEGVVALPLDVTGRESFAAFVDGVESRLGPLDVLVNNAGIMPIGPFVAEAEAATDRQLDINLRGVINGSRLAVERMQARDSGHIVNIASEAGMTGFPGLATYCATKHAVVGLSQSLYWELEQTGVEVSCVMPAIVDTELSKGMTQASFVKSVEPEDVGEAIASALERPRVAVHVPRAGGVIGKFAAALPERAQKAIFRAIGGDKAAVEVDRGARAGYEHRVAEVEPEQAAEARAKAAV